MTVSTTYLYNVAGNFAFDATKVAVANNKASLADQRPAGATFYASLAVALAADWSGPAGTAIGAGAIVAGHLDGNSASAKGVRWSPTINGPAGAVRFTVIPQYSGTPGARRYYYVQRAALSDVHSLLWCYHDTDGSLHVLFFDAAANNIVSLGAAFNPVSGTSYEIEIDWDFVGSLHSLYVNGTRIHQQTGTGTRANPAQHALGTSYDDGGGALANFTNLLLFSVPQHTGASYVPGVAPPATIYSLLNPAIQPNTPVTLDELLTFLASVDVTGSDAVQFYLLVNGVATWWNGSAWVASDTTYAQSNTAAQISANCVALGTVLNATMYVVALLHSATGATTPDIVSLTTTYNYFGVKPAGPAYCLLWGYLTDQSGGAAVGVTVQITVNDSYANQGYMVTKGVYKATTDANGYFAVNLEETTTAGVKYSFQTISADKKTITKLGDALIPNQANANIATLVFT